MFHVRNLYSLIAFCVTLTATQYAGAVVDELDRVVLKAMAEQIVYTMRMDNTAIERAEEDASAFGMPQFRWPTKGPVYLSYEPYSDLSSKQIVYYDEGTGAKGALTNADVKMRQKQLKNLDAVIELIKMVHDILT